MKKRVLVGAIIFAVVVAMVAVRAVPAVGLYVFDIFVGCLAILCSVELSKIFDKMGMKNYSILLGIYPSLMYVGHMISVLLNVGILTYVLIQLLILIAVFLIAYCYSMFSLKEQAKFTAEKLPMSYAKFAFKKSGTTLLGCLYPSVFFLFLLLINRIDSFSNVFAVVENYNGYLGLIILIFAFAIPMITDTFSMIFGMLIGGSKLCSKISPKKTVSGAVAGVIWTSLLCVIIYYVLGLFPTINAIFIEQKLEMYLFALLGIIGSVVCQCGDLFESMLKRKANVKDSGDFLKGHGGFLDRLDSHIFNAPFMFIFFLLII